MAKHFTGRCVTCKKLRTKPLQQLMGHIPKLRVVVGFGACSNTAINIFGPLQIRVGWKHERRHKQLSLPPYNLGSIINTELDHVFDWLLAN